MNFAPYQDASPDRERALSPPISPRPSLDRARQPIARIASPSIGTNAISPGPARQGSYFQQQNRFQDQRYRDVEAGAGAGMRSPGWNTVGADAGTGNGSGSGKDVDLFETRLGLRMDYEACLAYLGVPPVAGVLLLVLEHRSDYVRFHAWQSSLLFSFLFIIHVIFSWSSVISWLLFAGDLGLIGYLTFRAYQDAETLDRCEVPFFGPLASSILDDE
ncbi:hypothetical protein K490DRAFT_43855 [Saccharata proteae CBS 121410]|uniref:Uncharacterized protein n=1 Tax=Saccharata proteae CBS 121410 TaxID=1314787 RepID=A0A9P4LW23_9PEZI|nr:hypothetical protein K490DRAFT_43855 [Saccharata proteae CBS 121410]